MKLVQLNFESDRVSSFSPGRARAQISCYPPLRTVLIQPDSYTYDSTITTNKGSEGIFTKLQKKKFQSN